MTPQDRALAELLNALADYLAGRGYGTVEHQYKRLERAHEEYQRTRGKRAEQAAGAQA